MPRTINEILTEENEAQDRIGELYTIITDEVNADADLSGLTSTSKTAEFNLWKYIWAAMAWIQESIWEERQAAIQTVVDDGIPGTDRWLQKELLKFQYGDTLQFDNATAKYFYNPVTPANQIIKRCAVFSNGGLTQIKVAKEDGGGNPVALSAPELSAFAAYVHQIQWAGSNLAAPVSLASDKLNAPMTIYYNGTIGIDVIKPLVEAAWLAYLEDLPFNGEYKVTAHQDKIQQVANVNDVVPGSIQAKADAGAYGTVNRVYYPVSGYIEKDGAIDFDTMITYVAQ